MINRILLMLICASFALSAAGQPKLLFETSDGKESGTYEEVMNFYAQLSDRSTKISLQDAGPTDTPYPLSVVYYSNDSKFDIATWKAQKKLIILINNGIHPGEPDGIDASMLLLRDAVDGKLKVPDNVVLAVIPVFNIGGMLNRKIYTRPNQNGPVETGFRGNTQNLDLNRDFVKMDAKETQSLAALFHKLDPDILLDNHVSNGADYQHVMTLLTTQPDKLGGSMGQYMRKKLEPMIYADMKKRGYDLVPYVNVWGTTPDKGWAAFPEPPRFLSGFAAVFNTFSFVSETHMLKPYKDRVRATYVLMESMVQLAGEHAKEIQSQRMAQKYSIGKANMLAIDWKVDTTMPTMIELKGYEAGYKTSDISGQNRLYYDRSKPYTGQVPFYNTFYAKDSVTIPKAYVVSQGWHKVIDLLQKNGVQQIRRLQYDSTVTATVYYIEDYQTTPKPYEGHYLHSKVKVRAAQHELKLHKGDYIINMNEYQDARRYLVEMLEPTAPDAFFAWGFFDAVLQQKEYFSDYAFEELGMELLQKDEILKAKLEERRKADATFAKDGEQQLDFLYQNCCYHEAEHMRYPVFRLD